MWLGRVELRRCALIALLGLFAAGCGYHFAASGSGLPAQAKTICIEPFSNHTRFTGINDQFMRYLKDEIANHHRLALVDSPEGADLVLSGEVLYLNSIPVATNSVGEPITYNDSLSANATLLDGHTHQVVWTTRGVAATDQIPVVSGSVLTTSPLFLQQNMRAQDIARLPDIQVAQTQRESGREQIMLQLVRNLYSSMSEGF